MTTFENSIDLCTQITSSLSFESDEENDNVASKKDFAAAPIESTRSKIDTEKNRPTNPRPRPGRMRSKQLSDISLLLSESDATVPASPETSMSSIQSDASFLAGRSPQGRHRLRVKQPSDLSGMFAPSLPFTEEAEVENVKNKSMDTHTKEKSQPFPMLSATGQNRKGRIFTARLRKYTI